MAIFKCKMCGGELEIQPGSTVAECVYCGTKQTLPRLDDEKRANLYDRANHFRRNNEFDKAMGIYEQILNEDKTDAEAYWSLVLCRYGIEYVEDPSSHRRIPTVNRAQFTSIFDDDNYKSALQYADGSQRSLYEDEAKTINEIQKGILEISQKEEPFDVFICYKETDANGRRTQDSVLANDLYHQLTAEGFKVFFSRITLEDKLGVAYEPYIFAALNSAKVMVVLGTRPEYFNAVWVKNEWSRYLALIKNGAKKTLIPAYRDMDPYDLPDEFSHLQAQDMSKLGFMQDLIRGIKKIAQADAPRTAVKETVVVSGGNANLSALLDRAFMFLEDGDWQSANEYCERVLDSDPRNAQAYLGKLMAELHVRKQAQLADCAEPFDGSSSFQKAVRFADAELAAALNGYIDHINERNEKDRKTGIYNSAFNDMNSASTEDGFKAAAEKFESIPGFKDADEQRQQCLEKAEECRKDAIYNRAVKEMATNTIRSYETAIAKFESIRGWRDANDKIIECHDGIAELKRKQEADRIAAEKAAKKAKKIASIAIPAVVAVIAILLVITKIVIPNEKYGGKYNDAVALMDNGEYEEAITAFEALDGYKDSSDKIVACEAAITENNYNAAVALMDEGEYEEAIAAFEALDGYKDSEAKIASYEVECLKTAKVGDSVYFGTYEQDDDESNGAEDVEWLVLDKEGDKLLVISKYALDCQPYNTDWDDVTWESCTLRTWLNDDFLNEAFSADEQSYIVQTTVTADENPEYDTDPGNDTEDRIFLLSIDEAEKYFSWGSRRRCEPTDYAVANGAYESDSGDCWWWLRSPGEHQYSAACVLTNGSVGRYGFDVYYGCDAVRPALWINLDS